MRTLSLRGCPEVDDWFLARLHILQDSLEELDISHCPHITTGGLAALRNLKYLSKHSQHSRIIIITMLLCSVSPFLCGVCCRGLRRLDVSSLPRISNPGLVIILLEEMLPQCQITATGYDLSLRQEGEGGSKELG